MGLVQGATEFLPISSTAHLRLVPALLHQQDPGAAFTAVIQLGTVVAVWFHFHESIHSALSAWPRFFRRSDSAEDVQLLRCMIYGSLPIALVGYCLRHQIENGFRNLMTVCVALIVMSFVMLFAQRFGSKRRNLDQLNGWDILSIGLAQVLAVIPGVSRSGSTVSGAYARGFSLEAAGRLSFIMSIPPIIGAAAFELASDWRKLISLNLGATVLATVVAFASGYLVIKYFLDILLSKGLKPFVWYRLALAAVIIFLLASKIISPT